MSANKSPWAWVPSLYFAEGLPYVIVNVLSVTMFKRLGMPNAELALYTSLLYLPWVIKPLWSPVVDVLRTKRWWILVMQALLALSLLGLSLSVPSRSYALMLTIFYLTAFASATHDIAADGFYMLALSTHTQSLFVGIRSTFYRIATVFGQGVLVVIAGLLETRLGDIPRAWEMTLLGCSVLLFVLFLWHRLSLPAPECVRPAAKQAQPLQDIGRSVVTFFRKPGIVVAMLFLLLFRLPEALSVKMLTPFLNNMFLFISFGIIALARLKTEFAAKHMIFLFITLVISLLVIMGLKYVDRIERFMYIFAIVGIILLLIVAFFGQVENGAKLSFAAGPIRFQPSEFIKLSFLFFISGCIVTFKDMRGFLIASIGSAVHVVALVLARDLGTALIFLTAYVFVMFIAYKNYIVLSLEIGVATIGGISLFSTYSD